MKKSKGNVFSIIILIIVFSCNSNRIGKEKIIELTHSEKPCNRVEGFLAIGNFNDTSLYYLFFEDMRDMNITHCTKYYGKSVLWAKIESLKRITKIAPKIEYDIMTPIPKILEEYKNIIESLNQ